MRNTAEYPVTKEEVEKAMLEAMQLIDKAHKGEFGSIQPYAMRLAFEFLMDHSNFPTWLEMKG